MSSYFIHVFRMYRISDFGRVRGLAFFPRLDQDLYQHFEAFVEELAPYMMILDTVKTERGFSENRSGLE